MTQHYYAITLYRMSDVMLEIMSGLHFRSKLRINRMSADNKHRNVFANVEYLQVTRLIYDTPHNNQ